MIMAEGRWCLVFYCDLYTKALVKRVFSRPVPQFCLQCCGFAVTGVMSCWGIDKALIMLL